jgi:Tannase and feruloyl esterase
MSTPMGNCRQLVFSSAILLSASSAFGAPSATPCTQLADLKLPHITITHAQIVRPGEFKLPSDSPPAPSDFFTAFGKLQAFCRVEGVTHPTSDSHIEFEVWLPESSWNGKYEGAGNGGFSGSINYYRLAEAINAGYVGSSTDTGHKGSSEEVDWAAGHPEKIIDFDYRAIHETAEIAKAIISAFYGKPPARSYFSSCSNGGRQGLMEAQRYPEDYDGILAGAPWNPGTISSSASDVSAENDKNSVNLNATNPNLKSFEQRGGKLIIYRGENDGPTLTIQYYESVVSTIGVERTNKFVQLYVVPGMGHCEGGSIAGDFGQRLQAHDDPQHNIIVALELWVEQGIVPQKIIATKYKTDGAPESGVIQTRPLCPFSKVAVYRGSGSASEAANYSCSFPHRP